MIHCNKKYRSIGLFGALLLSVGALATPASAQSEDTDLQAKANAAFTESNFGAAETALRELIARDGESPAVLFQLARALHGQNELNNAEKAYESARKAGFQPTARIDYHLARIESVRGNRLKSLAFLDSMANTSGPIAATIEATAEFAEFANDPSFKSILTRLRPCPLDEQRQFDFWVGKWNVTAAGQPFGGATSNIESIQNGCAVLENYNAGNFAGTSINFYDSTRKVWHQSWMSNTGNVFYAEGGLNKQGEMVLSDEGLAISAATGTINTVTWTPLDDGRVRQHWQASTDGGTSWQTVFDGYYSPREAND